jgi:23S rRNA (guanosine2251-2'-O)-methyltransferase
VAVKTAMGAVEHMPVARETNLVASIEKIKESGIWVYGAAVTGGVAPWKVDLKGPLCLVVGGEGEGVRPLVARSCDGLITIPMKGQVGSLNVGAAVAVLCYETARQRLSE